MQPSETVMNPKQVFLSVLIFGVAGLHLFIYLQAWIKEQHTATEVLKTKASQIAEPPQRKVLPESYQDP
ncbi:carbohydrate sulfotransferase 9-like [Balaenoptera acutorostrata]|uniref:Carbohydrate sulfotransferase 9-like n=1 Tax=Balaenoptera acutorostrata TaxID=9767 RepID=A0ABM3RZU0_BALAC|nr:carbohydrate sulfotransferase 9-like [Balaenoptera acutorostrata]